MEFFKKKVETNQTSMSDNEIIKSKDLLMIVILLKKLSYAIGAFNSYSVGLIKMIENSLFGMTIYVDQEDKLRILDGLDEENENNYIQNLKSIFANFSKETIEKVNDKIRNLEELMNSEIPELRELYFEEATPLKLAKQGCTELSSEISFNDDQIFPKIIVYKSSKKESKDIIIDNISRIHYPECSELLFIQTKDFCTIILDISKRKICFKFVDWPFKISNILVRRNLNYFRVVDPNRFRFLTINELKKNNEGRINKSDPLILSNVMLEEDLRDNLFSVEMIKNYFENLEDKIWFYKEGIVDSYIFAVKDDDTNCIYFFNLKVKPTQEDAGGSIRLVKREFSLKNINSFTKELKKKKRQDVNKSFSR